MNTPKYNKSILMQKLPTSEFPVQHSMKDKSIVHQTSMNYRHNHAYK